VGAGCLVPRAAVPLVVVPSGLTEFFQGQRVVVHRRVPASPSVAFLILNGGVLASRCTTVTFPVRMCFPAEVASAPSHVRRFRFRTLDHLGSFRGGRQPDSLA
jgi:hypothetical protein